MQIDRHAETNAGTHAQTHACTHARTQGQKIYLKSCGFFAINSRKKNGAKSCESEVMQKVVLCLPETPIARLKLPVPCRLLSPSGIKM